jgi:hypothetical protein
MKKKEIIFELTEDQKRKIAEVTGKKIDELFFVPEGTKIDLEKMVKRGVRIMPFTDMPVDI